MVACLADELAKAVDKVADKVKETTAAANAHRSVLAQSRVESPLADAGAVILELAGAWAAECVPHAWIVGVAANVGAGIGHAGGISLK